MTVLVLGALAATWQQGLLEDGLNEIRRHDTNTLDDPSGSGASGSEPLEPTLGGIFTFPEGWIPNVMGEDDLPQSEADRSATRESEAAQRRGPVLAETADAILYAGSTTGVEPSDVVMRPIAASENTAETEGLLDDGVDISIGAVPEEGEFILTLTLSEEPSPDALPGVWHVSDSGEGQLILGVWDSDANTITISVTEFSRFWGGWWNPINWIVEGIDYVADYLTGRTDPPDCRNDAPSWATLTTRELSSVHVCLQAGTPIDGRETVEIIIKSNRGTMQIMEFPREAERLWVQLQPEWMRTLLVDIASLIEVKLWNEPSPRDSAAVLFGGKLMTYEIARPRNDMHLVSHAYVTMVLGVANLLFSIVGVREGPEILTLVVFVKDCVDGILTTETDRTNPNSEPEDYVEPVLGCVVEAIKNPEAAAQAAEQSARLAGLSDDLALRAGESVRNTLDSGRMRGVSKILRKVTSVASLVTNAWDSIFDSVAEGEMTLSFVGDPSLPPRSRFAPVDYDEIEKTTGETPVILIADVSGSMDDLVDGTIKLELAKLAMLDFLETISSTREVALRSYPAGGREDCNSGELQFDFSRKRPEMEMIIGGLRAGGDTPTAEALQAAVDDISWAGFDQAEIALFSDGLANCDDPCQVAEEIGASGSEIRVHVGAFVDSAEGRQALKCIADETEGTYTEGSGGESDFAEELGEFLERNSKPRLEVSLEPLESVTPSTGPSAEAQEVGAIVYNDSNVAAKDVVVVLETVDASGPTSHPVAVGNIAPGAESAVSWSVRPGFGSVGTEMGLALSATAANTEQVVSSTGSVAVEDPNLVAEAGPILGVGQVVVMGDQLLSGVGTSTRGHDGGCRRSREVGLLDVFGQPPERSVACANALMAHLAAPDWAKDVDSQVSQLAELMERGGAVNAVVLSIGATDFGLSELARECVMSTVPCDSEVSGIPTDVWLVDTIADGPRHAAASEELVRALGAVDEALNGTRAQSRGTRQVPILLLAQPRAFPFVHGACFERWQGEGMPLLTQPELNLYHYFVSVVNGALEAASLAAQDLGLPVFYVDATESAYLPDHTACSAEPYVQSLEPLAEAGASVIATLSEGGLAAVAGEALIEDILVELGEEFLVPNQYGEQAIASAVLRWSQSDEAEEADYFVTDEFQRRSAGIAPRVSDQEPGETRPLGREGRLGVEPGRGWTASASGFLPGALVRASVVPGGRVVASAVADEDGTAELYVAVPRDIADGDVTLVASGLSRSGEAASVEQTMRILPPLRPIHSVALPALAVLLLLSSLGLWRASRRIASPSPPPPDDSQ